MKGKRLLPPHCLAIYMVSLSSALYRGYASPLPPACAFNGNIKIIRDQGSSGSGTTNR